MVGASGIFPRVSWQFDCWVLQSTVLREAWTRLYQLANDAINDEDSNSQVARLNKRILSSLKPDKTMAFVLDLMNPGGSPMQHAVPPNHCSHTSLVNYVPQRRVCVHGLHVKSLAMSVIVCINVHACQPEACGSAAP